MADTDDPEPLAGRPARCARVGATAPGLRGSHRVVGARHRRQQRDLLGLRAPVPAPASRARGRRTRRPAGVRPTAGEPVHGRRWPARIDSQLSPLQGPRAPPGYRVGQRLRPPRLRRQRLVCRAQLRGRGHPGLGYLLLFAATDAGAWPAARPRRRPRRRRPPRGRPVPRLLEHQIRRRPLRGRVVRGGQRRPDDDRRRRPRRVLRHDYAGCARDLRAAGDGAHRAAARRLGRLQRPQRPLALRLGAPGARHLPFASGAADECALRRPDARGRVPAAAQRPRHHRPRRVPGPPADPRRRRTRPQLRPRGGTTGAGGTVRGHRAGAGHCRRQRGEPAVGAGRRPRAGNRGAAVAGRVVGTAGSPAPDRGRGARRPWRHRRRRGRADDADRAHDDVPVSGQRDAGLRGQHAGAAVLDRHRPADRARVRPRAGAAQRPRQRGRRAAGPAGARIGLARRPAAAHQPGDGADCARHGAAGAVGALSRQPGQPLAGRHRDAARRAGDVLAVSGAERLLRRAGRGLLRPSRRIARRHPGRALRQRVVASGVGRQQSDQQRHGGTVQRARRRGHAGHHC